MSTGQMSAGIAGGAAAQGATASPSIEVLLTELGERHRAALNQAQVLSKVAGVVQASLSTMLKTTGLEPGGLRGVPRGSARNCPRDGER